MNKAEEYDNLVPDYDDIFINNNPKKKSKNRFFSRLLKFNSRSLILSMFIYIFQSAPVYIIPLCTANIINYATEAIQNGMNDNLLKLLIINAAIMVVSIVMNVPLTMLRWRVASKGLRRTSACIRCSVVRKLQSLSITYFKDMENGKVQSKYLKDTESIDGLFSNIYHNFSLAAVGLIISIIISVVKNGYVSLFFLIVIPINIIIVKAFGKRIRKGYKDYRVDTENMSVRLSSMLDMMFITKSHGLENLEFHHLKNSIGHVASSGRELDNIQAKFGSAIFLINTLMKAINLFFCIFLAIKGYIKIGDVVLFQSLFTEISNNVLNLINSTPVIGSGIDAINSISDIMNIKDVETFLGKKDIANLNGEIRFDHVTYCYPTGGNVVIDDLCLTVKEGECIAVVGSSGSGKTTLMNMIIGFLKPTRGNIFIDNQNIDDINLEEYRHHISVVPQNSILFSGSVKDNITYGLDHYSENDLKNAIEMSNLQEVLDKLDNGIETNIGEHGDKLSGGQKQRVTIARALIRNPRILIFDEATSALDNISEYHVQKAIQASIKGRTTFIVAHRLSTIQNADEIYVVEDGKIVEHGSHQNLLDLNQEYAKLYKAQFERKLF